MAWQAKKTNGGCFLFKQQHAGFRTHSSSKLLAFYIDVQESRKEMVSELGSMLKSRLYLWKSQVKHTAFLENLLVYRDGVSEGQYAMVREAELPLLRRAKIGSKFIPHRSKQYGKGQGEKCACTYLGPAQATAS